MLDSSWANFALKLLKMLWSPWRNGVSHMWAWLKLFHHASRNLEVVEKAKVEEAHLQRVKQAIEFGHPLCDCTLPPQIMVRTMPEPGLTVWRCPNCTGEHKDDRRFVSVDYHH